MTNESREAFEAHTTQGGKYPATVHRGGDGEYSSPFTRSTQRAWQAALQWAASQQAAPEGMRLVPVEPTEEMLRAGCASELPALFKQALRLPSDGAGTAKDVERIISRHAKSYAAMLAAAPTAQGERE